MPLPPRSCWRCAHPGGRVAAGWASRQGLRATWFRGQPTALLAARPAAGPGPGVRIDDFRLPGYRVFYASRGGGHVPAPLNAEVAAVSRITSFGQVQSVGDPSGPATGGLGPGGFLHAYDVRPLWRRGDLGQGETIVFFEVDGYSPPPTWRPTRPGSACPALPTRCRTSGR